MPKSLAMAAAAVVAALIMTSLPAAGAAVYKFVDLTPNAIGSRGAAATDGIQGGNVGTSSLPRAAIWADTPSSIRDLHPVGNYDRSAVEGADGNRQVGVAYPVVSNLQPIVSHAMVWTSTAASAVDLHPTGALASYGNGSSALNNEQVGSVSSPTFGSYTHATIWHGTKASALDINPLGFQGSSAEDTDGVHQVGLGWDAAANIRALLWSGTAASAVDLTPAGAISASAYGVGGTQQTGYALFYDPGSDTTSFHAGLWQGSAASFVDLTPGLLVGGNSVARPTNGTNQVGSINGPGIPNFAALWSGTPESYINLHAFLPAGYASSVAECIAPDGTIVGTATTDTGASHAVMWVPVPEPTGGLCIAALAGWFTARRRMR